VTARRRRPTGHDDPLPLARPLLAPWRDVVSQSTGVEFLSCGHMYRPTSSDEPATRRRCGPCHQADDLIDSTYEEPDV